MLIKYHDIYSEATVISNMKEEKIIPYFYAYADYDPQVIEQKEQSQPSCLPLSYVLRFITDDARKEGTFTPTPATNDAKRKLAIKHHSYSMSSSNRSNTPTGTKTIEHVSFEQCSSIILF